MLAFDLIIDAVVLLLFALCLLGLALLAIVLVLGEIWDRAKVRLMQRRGTTQRRS
jgi:hypothetical protein